MLMFLTRPSHFADLASFQLDRHQYKLEGVVFLPSAIAKQSSQERVLREFFFPTFPHKSTLCPVETLQQYEPATACVRPEDTTKLLVAMVKPQRPVASCTIARWLRWNTKTSRYWCLDIQWGSIYACSCRCWCYYYNMKAANWSTESVFRRHYYRPPYDVSFDRAVLSSSTPVRPHLVIQYLNWVHGLDFTLLKLQTTPLICETEQMAQITKWLQKAKSSISMVPFTLAQTIGFAVKGVDISSYACTELHVECMLTY